MAGSETLQNFTGNLPDLEQVSRENKKVNRDGHQDLMCLPRYIDADL